MAQFLLKLYKAEDGDNTLKVSSHCSLFFSHGALTPFGPSLAPSALQGLPFKIRWLRGTVSPTVLEHFCSPKHPLWCWKAGTSQVFQGNIERDISVGHISETLGLSGEIQAAPQLSHMLKKASVSWSLFCAEFSPAMPVDSNLGTCLGFSLGEASSCCSCSALPSNTEIWDVWPWSHGDKKMSVPERKRRETSWAKSRTEDLLNKQRINLQKQGRE